MATEAASVPNAQVVGNAFVAQYYNMLSQAPQDVHKFYQDSSVMIRPGPDGFMSSVSTMSRINELILALEYKNCEVEILSADAQKSFGEGVIVLVTGFLTGKDELRRKFTELFFLAPQEDNGFFVLNDVLRYVDEEESVAVVEPLAPVDPEPTPTLEQQPTETLPEEETVQPVVDESQSTPQLENGDIAIAEKEFVPNHVAETPKTDPAPAAISESKVEEQQVPETETKTETETETKTETETETETETAAPISQEDAPKKSYASIANALNFKAQPFQQRIVPKPVVRAPPLSTDAEPIADAAPAPAPAARPARTSSVERNSYNNNTVKGHSIFVANLPMDATPEQLIEKFQAFGPIKPTGVQVRSYKLERNCFGFIEFETAEAVENALQVATIMIGNREAHIEKKKADGEAGKFPPRRGGYRGGGRGGSYAGGRGGGYVKSEFDSNGGGGNYGRGGGRNNGDANPKVYQNGGGRGGRQSRPPPAASSGAAATAAEA